MHTANFKDLGVVIRYNDKREVEGFDGIGHVWCSSNSIENHQEKIKKIADERNDGKIGLILRYDEIGKKEWYAAPSLKVYWSKDWE
jgi:hypothetical protein